MDPSATKRTEDHWGGRVVALAVIAVGLLFLLRNLGIELPFRLPARWWSVFLFVAAAGPLVRAYQRYRARQRLDGATLRSLISAALLVTLGLVFLTGLSWNRWWPIFIIYGGLWMLSSHWRADSRTPQ